MLSGRHLIFLGALAGGGLLSVKDSQDQVALGYEMAKVETGLRETREAIETGRARLQAMQAPPKVIERIADLHVEVGPASPLAIYTPARPLPSAAEQTPLAVREAGDRDGMRRR